MTKKLIGLLAVALFGITTMNAAPCTLGTSGTNTATGVPGNQAPTLPNGSPAVFTCSFTIPSGDTLGTVTFGSSNSFQNATAPQTNNLQFSYTVTGFSGVTTLTDTVQGTATTGFPVGDNGADPDTAGLSGTFTAGATCLQGNDVSFQCSTSTFAFTPGQTSFSFTVSGAATWLSGNLTNGGGESFTVSVSDTYTVPPPPVPEPGTFVMMGGGLIGLVVAGRRKFRA